MDDNFRIPSPPRQVTTFNKGDSDRVNRAPIAPRRTLYSNAELAGENTSPSSVPTSFADAMMEAAASLAPETVIKNSRNAADNLARQTASMNLLATQPANMAALQPAVFGYAVHIANQVNLEGNMPVHHPWKSSFGDRFRERDRTDGHVRVPPINETRGGPSVL